MFTTCESVSSSSREKATPTGSVGLDGIEHLFARSASADPNAHSRAYEGSAGPTMVRATQSDLDLLARSSGAKRYREPWFSNRNDGRALDAVRRSGTPGMKEQE